MITMRQQSIRRATGTSFQRCRPISSESRRGMAAPRRNLTPLNHPELWFSAACPGVELPPCLARLNDAPLGWCSEGVRLNPDPARTSPHGMSASYSVATKGTSSEDGCPGSNVASFQVLFQVGISWIKLKYILYMQLQITTSLDC